jgi:hypothetical protein
VDAPFPGAVDARGDRLVQSAIGVVCLAGFVFGLPWIAAVLTVVLGVGAALGPRGNALHLLFERFGRDRLRSGDAAIAASVVRAQDAFLAGLCASATLAYFAGVSAIGGLILVGAGLVAIVAATTRIHAGNRLLGRYFS